MTGPAPYSTTDEHETLAIDTFRFLIDHERVRVTLIERSTFPNIDGYVELSESRTPIGKLDVQIKKLPDDCATDPRIQCPTSLCSYSEVTCNPVLLIGVDVKQKKAYWVHLSNDFITKLGTRIDQDTILVHFPVENVIDGSSTDYIESWTSIVKTQQEKTQSSEKLRRAYEELAKKSTPALGAVKSQFKEIHNFLDDLNTLLEEKFSVVKEIFFSSAWKIGLAYYKYEDNLVCYTLYPIAPDKNDVQIKEITEIQREELIMDGLGFTALGSNPIKNRPSLYALQVVERDISEILKNRLLHHNNNKFLAKEYIFALIDQFSLQMGLEQKDMYTLDEIEYGLYHYLPLWIEEAVGLIATYPNGEKILANIASRHPYFDPDTLVSLISEENRNRVRQSIQTRIERGDLAPSFRLGSRKFSFRTFMEFLSHLKSDREREIDRVYLKKDYSRLGDRGGWVWNAFSPSAVESNLRLFFNHLPQVYNDIIAQNFPQISEEIPLFGEARKVVIVFDVREKYDTFEECPSIQIYCLKDESKNRLEIEVYRKEESPDIQYGKPRQGVSINGEVYEPVLVRSSILNFIFNDTPMFDFVYEILEDNLKSYFNKMKTPK